MEAPRGSVITPTRNRLELLRQTMDSVAAQTLQDWEHIIVDDGSDDGTAEEVERRAAADARVRFIRREGQRSGANVCRNLGIRASRGEFVVFLDSDDLLTADCLARRVERLSRNADADFITFETSFFVEEIDDHAHWASHDLLGDDLTRFLFFETPWIITAPLWRRAALDRIGYFDESLPSWQDVELHVRALTRGLRYLRFPEVDHHVRWQNAVGRISADQRNSPHHLGAALGVFDLFERHVREGPGMNWIRQRALCSLYFFIAQRWVEAGQVKLALDTWRVARDRGLAPPLVHAQGTLLLSIQGAGLPCERLINKWRGWVRLRTNAEVVAAH